MTILNNFTYLIGMCFQAEIAGLVTAPFCPWLSMFRRTDVSRMLSVLFCFLFLFRMSKEVQTEPQVYYPCFTS